MQTAPMSLGGIGPRLALLSLPYVALSVAVMIRYPEFGNLELFDAPWARAAGFTLLAAGVILWASSAVTLVRHFSSGRLITTGPFALCRNPLYAAIILFILPAVGIILHSALVISFALVVYIGFKISIHGETRALEAAFGTDYLRYTREVNELLPFPRRM